MAGAFTKADVSGDYRIIDLRFKMLFYLFGNLMSKAITPIIHGEDNPLNEEIMVI